MCQYGKKNAVCPSLYKVFRRVLPAPEAAGEADVFRQMQKNEKYEWTKCVYFCYIKVQNWF
jgi:hypothetical protein